MGTKFFAVCLISLLVSASTSAEEPTVSGQVRLVDGSAVAGAQVLLFDVSDLRRGAVGQATTDGSGRFALSLAGFDKLSSQLGGSGLPQGFALGQNYPNPFNPSTVIPYQLSTTAHVRLDVFNVLGQRVATLVDGAQLAGFHSVRWDATDRFGRSVASGVYLYRLLVDGSVQQTKRMVLVDGQAGVASPGAGVGPVAPAVAPVVSVEGDYGLVIGGAGIVPYVDGAFAVRAGMASVAFVVERAGSPQGAVLARPLLGDVTGDGRVNRADALVVMTHSLDASVGLPPNGDMSLGDVNGDGRVDRTDAQAIMGYAANPLDGSLPVGIGKAVARGKRVGASGAQGIGEALSLFGAVADALKDNLEADYQNGRKWLGFLKAGEVVNATIWVDLADYAEVSPEGRGDAGDQWVTIWIDIGYALDWPPIAAGVVALDFEPNVPDPRRAGVHADLGSLSGVTAKASLVEDSLGDDGSQLHYFNVEVGGFEGFDRLVSPQASAGELQTSLYAFEIKKSLFDLLVVGASSNIVVGVLSQADFRGVVTGLLGSFLAFDGDGIFSALSDLTALTLGGVRRFTSSDTGKHREIDGYFSGVYSSLGHVEDAPVENGDTLIVNFQNTGNTVANFRVERRVLTEGWRIDSLRPEDLFWGIKNFNWWSGEADMNNVEPDERGGTAWQVFAATHAPELGWIRFYLYHDRLGPFETLLDSMDVAVQRSPNLGDLARVTDLRMQQSSLRRNAYFLFSLSEASQVRFALSVLSADANLYLMRAGGREEVIASSRNGGTADEELVASLEPGIYYLRVHVLGYDVSRTLRYQLSYSNETAGRYPLVIRDFGDLVDLADAATQEGWVNSVDNRDDYYAFALSQPQGVLVALRGLSGDADLYLEDALGQPLGSSTHGGTADEVIDQSLGAGIYYLRVEARGSGALRYQVELSLQGASGGGDGGVAGEERSFSLSGGGEMAFVWIGPGTFMMGSDNGSSNERPVHEVEISRGFWLGKYEVTQGGVGGGDGDDALVW